jgi:hypothetical protein
MFGTHRGIAILAALFLAALMAPPLIESGNAQTPDQGVSRSRGATSLDATRNRSTNRAVGGGSTQTRTAPSRRGSVASPARRSSTQSAGRTTSQVRTPIAAPPPPEPLTDAMVAYKEAIGALNAAGVDLDAAVIRLLDDEDAEAPFEVIHADMAVLAAAQEAVAAAQTVAAQALADAASGEITETTVLNMNARVGVTLGASTPDLLAAEAAALRPTQALAAD